MNARDVKIQSAIETLKLIEAAIYADTEARADTKDPRILAEVVNRRVDSTVRLYVAVRS
jgi:hypothetical protein